MVHDKDLYAVVVHYTATEGQTIRKHSTGCRVEDYAWVLFLSVTNMNRILLT